MNKIIATADYMLGDHKLKLKIYSVYWGAPAVFYTRNGDGWPAEPPDAEFDTYLILGNRERLIDSTQIFKKNHKCKRGAQCEICKKNDQLFSELIDTALEAVSEKELN